VVAGAQRGQTRRAVRQVPREKLVAERERLVATRAALEREWKGIPRLAFALLLVFPALFVGPLAALLVFAGVLSLIGVTAYLVGFRIREAQQEIDTVERELARLDHLEGRDVF